eukprot:GHVT01032228.1.p1 GENE.GHVT01032228.1~~GHVT01032228.1.p1  ORF type:complete len:103 (+),score=4.69 GHVT01032228.1:1362-1670(+)
MAAFPQLTPFSAAQLATKYAGDRLRRLRHEDNTISEKTRKKYVLSLCILIVPELGRRGERPIGAQFPTHDADAACCKLPTVRYECHFVLCVSEWFIRFFIFR